MLCQGKEHDGKVGAEAFLLYNLAREEHDNFRLHQFVFGQVYLNFCFPAQAIANNASACFGQAMAQGKFIAVQRDLNVSFIQFRVGKDIVYSSHLFSFFHKQNCDFILINDPLVEIFTNNGELIETIAWGKFSTFARVLIIDQ